MGLDGVELIVNSSGSYMELRKAYVAVDLITSASSKSGGVYMFSNLRGCDGQRVYFNGCSCVALNGGIVARGAQYELKDVVSQYFVANFYCLSSISNDTTYVFFYRINTRANYVNRKWWWPLLTWRIFVRTGILWGQGVKWQLAVHPIQESKWIFPSRQTTQWVLQCQRVGQLSGSTTPLRRKLLWAQPAGFGITFGRDWKFKLFISFPKTNNFQAFWSRGLFSTPQWRSRLGQHCLHCPLHVPAGRGFSRQGWSTGAKWCSCYGLGSEVRPNRCKESVQQNLFYLLHGHWELIWGY